MKLDEAVSELKKGNFIILLDDKMRENEGDLVIAADKVNEEKLNFMLKVARGILCMPLSPKRLDELKIPMMVQKPNDRFGTPFTVSIDHTTTSTGVSVNDRLKTIKAVLNPKSKPEDFMRPGHMFPLRASEKGLLGRKGHTEAAIELMKLAGLYPAALIAEIMDDNGSMASVAYLDGLSKKYKIGIISIEEILGEDEGNS